MKKKILVFTGAGVSAESGIQTFRDLNNGLWYNYKVEDVATPEGWRKDRSKVLDFYNQRRDQLKDVKPNLAHKIIADLEKDYDVTVITQNVDDLHERAGSTNVVHLHGELTKARGCMYDHKSSQLDNIIDIGYNPINIGDKCSVTGSQLRPHIVWFGEMLDSGNIDYSRKVATMSDVCIVVGTSMQVTPANTIPFLTKETSTIYYVDLSDIDFYIPDQRRAFFQHYQEPASTGMQKVYDDLIKIYKNA